jgi:integrase
MKGTKRLTFAACCSTTHKGEYYDADIGGLSFVVTAHGTRTFFLRYRLGGERKRLKLCRFNGAEGEWTAARQKALQALSDLALGKNPAPDVDECLDRTPETFSSLITAFIEHQETVYGAKADRKSKHVREQQRALERFFLPHWGAKAPDKITRSMVQSRLIDIMSTAGGYTSNRARSTLSRLFQWAVTEKEWLPRNPVIGVKPVFTERARVRILSDDEIKGMWSAANDMAYVAGDVIKLLLLTGQRESNVVGLRDADIDGNWWSVPGEETKNGDGVEVYLPTATLEIVESLPRMTGPFLLSGTQGTRPFSGWSKAKAAVVARSGLKSDWHFHDIRGTMATWLFEQNVSEPVVDRILNHKTGDNGSVTRSVYNRSKFRPHMEAAWTQWAEHVLDLVA